MEVSTEAEEVFSYAMLFVTWIAKKINSIDLICIKNGFLTEVFYQQMR